MKPNSLTRKAHHVDQKNKSFGLTRYSRAYVWTMVYKEREYHQLFMTSFCEFFETTKLHTFLLVNIKRPPYWTHVADTYVYKPIEGVRSKKKIEDYTEKVFRTQIRLLEDKEKVANIFPWSYEI